IKALIFPLTLKHALRLTNTRREIEPIIGFSTSCIFGVLILVFSYWLSNKISYHFGDVLKLKLTFSIFTIFTGLFIIISRTKAITQVIGYIIFENGIYLLGNTFLIKENIIVELGIVLDLLVFVLISGIVIFRINKTFDHINASLLMKDDQKGVS
ncbi:MAG TPA: hypothetical protein PLJ44_03770, partial [Victivallales bacterium]|nr:hypothetical protein [Victivallales bacterium]